MLKKERRACASFAVVKVQTVVGENGHGLVRVQFASEKSNTGSYFVFIQTVQDQGTGELVPVQPREIMVPINDTTPRTTAVRYVNAVS